MSAEHAPVSLTIILCTFHREALLRQALQSLLGQQVPRGCQVEIVVVDNSDAGTARSVVESLKSASPFPLRWIEAHPANISVARNAGVAAAATPFIGFLDDDQRVDPGWLEAVARAARNPDFDAHFGRNEARFETPERTTPAILQLFTRVLDAPAGTELFAMGPRKTPGITLATANSLFRRAAMLVGPGPFDPAFGAGGGEDYDLICRMQRRGSRFAWMPDAVASELVPASRCAPAYMRRRIYAGGQAYAAAVSNASDHPARMRWLMRLKAIVQAALMLPLFAVRAAQGRAALLDHGFAFAGVLGKIAFGAIHPLYRRVDAEERAGR
ncbi:MAG TPA: glycosyltransferase family 2 protein [Beijerinckiaceae bacterium]|nr:glycosyltransferase family 2 protein [Beijerinckiaceae bacterium]